MYFLRLLRSLSTYQIPLNIFADGRRVQILLNPILPHQWMTKQLHDSLQIDLCKSLVGGLLTAKL